MTKEKMMSEFGSEERRALLEELLAHAAISNDLDDWITYHLDLWRFSPSAGAEGEFGWNFRVTRLLSGELTSQGFRSSAYEKSRTGLPQTVESRMMALSDCLDQAIESLTRKDDEEDD